MYCHNCGFSLSEDQVFCPNCGKFVAKDGAFPSPTSSYAPSVAPGSGKTGINSIWYGLIVFLSIGWVISATEFIISSWGWYFNVDINYNVIRIASLILFSLCAVFGLLLSKSVTNKTKMLLGYSLITISLIVELISSSFILAIIGLIILFTGVSFLLASLPKNGAIHLWIYPFAGILGAILASFIIYPLNERFGGSVIPLITTSLIIITSVILAFLYRKELPTGKTYPVKQWLFIIGTVIIIFASFYIVEIIQRLMRGLPIF